MAGAALWRSKMLPVLPMLPIPMLPIANWCTYNALFGILALGNFHAPLPPLRSKGADAHSIRMGGAQLEVAVAKYCQQGLEAFSPRRLQKHYGGLDVRKRCPRAGSLAESFDGQQKSL